MARSRSDLLGSLGKLFSIFKKVVDNVLELGGSDEEIARIDTDTELAQELAAHLVGKLPIVRKVSQHGWTLEKVVNHGHHTLFHLALYRIDGTGRRFTMGQQVGTAERTSGYITFLELPEKEDELPKISVFFSRGGSPVPVTPEQLIY